MRPRHQLKCFTGASRLFLPAGLWLAAMCGLGQSGTNAAPKSATPFEKLFGERGFADESYYHKPPATVFGGFEIQEIRDIAPATGSFKARLYVWLYWDEPRAAPNLPDGQASLAFDAQSIFERGLVWNPEPSFSNSLEPPLIDERTVEVFPQQLEYWFRAAGTFTDRAGALDFRWFPFDSQKLRIELETPYSTKLVKLTADPTDDPDVVREQVRSLRNAEWEFTDAYVEESTVSYFSEEDGTLSQLSIVIDAQRRSGFYLVHIYLPIFIILSLCYFALWLPEKWSEAIVGTFVTCLLSLIAFNFIVSEDIPKVGYLTVMHISIAVAYLFILVSYLSYMVYLRSPDNERRRKMYALVRGFLGVVIAGGVAWIVGLFAVTQIYS
jgi:hypothetical protein